MASQGQRFRRKALRRGYKVDEVDAFLDRVEATLAGESVGAPVASQDVHDVVFRVRFGGYDEWQVDLHLDRVERQLAELEERGGPNRGPDPRMAPPERMGPPPERMGPPLRDERGMAPVPPPLPPRPMPAQAGPPPEQYGRYDEPTGAFGGGYDDPRGGYDRPPVPAGPGGPGGGYGAPEERFDGFEAGRHGKMDMTAEIRMPDRDPRAAGMGMPPMGGAPGFGDPAMQRIDQIRRTFQVRRFGSGYDPMQVDRLFEGILNAMSGRGPMPVPENDLDTLRFGLVSGGYFEAEVDAALREVKDILLRRR
ncbi:DivIVA domain-containing protein [Micromonospora pattaloongensis]|uniref:Cell wall synthesis protein Wag31 n=1 Tax=Micromonospora pattaloongensis TaxID=405436 RepID=A0A1H3KQ16_9ACTN|nr:DivIVA domain-containing protein [Micromonospora pattaloongensis]SDY53754.1 DivIVA domain-containing protein [Micromonospora pattaloongensis]